MIGLVPGDSVADRESQWFSDLAGILFAVYAGRNDADPYGVERGTAFLISGQKPDAIGSPIASIVKDDAHRLAQIIG
jgi:hypothetical protein